MKHLEARKFAPGEKSARERIDECVALGLHNEHYSEPLIHREYGSHGEWIASTSTFCQHCNCGHVASRPATQQEIA